MGGVQAQGLLEALLPLPRRGEGEGKGGGEGEVMRANDMIPSILIPIQNGSRGTDSRFILVGACQYGLMMDHWLPTYVSTASSNTCGFNIDRQGTTVYGLALG